jgi:TonB family protein
VLLWRCYNNSRFLMMPHVRSKLPGMRRNRRSLPPLFLSIAVLAVIEIAAQSVETAHGGPSLSKLYDPIYPPLARQARISGDVVLSLRIRQDGSIESVELVSGHPMLTVAAIESARASHFECTNCASTVPAYSLTYEFRILASDPEEYCKNGDQQRPPELDASLHNVSVFANEIWTCDPSATIRRTYTSVRSAKCLYLWKCSRRLEKEEMLN